MRYAWQKERLSKDMSFGGTVKDLGSPGWEPGYEYPEAFADARVIASLQLWALAS